VLRDSHNGAHSANQATKPRDETKRRNLAEAAISGLWNLAAAPGNASVRRFASGRTPG